MSWIDGWMEKRMLEIKEKERAGRREGRIKPGKICS